MKRCFVLLAMLCFALTFVCIASADTIAISFSGATDSLTGTLYATNNLDGTWTVTGINAIYDGITVTTIIPTGTDPHFVYDNLYYYPPNPTYFDNAGLLFDVPTVGEVNLCYTGAAPCGNAGYTFIVWDGNAYTFNSVTSYSFGAPIPEPSSLLLMGSGLLAACGAVRRRFIR